MGKKKRKNKGNKSNLNNTKNITKNEQTKEIKKDNQSDIKREYEIKKVIPVLEFESLDGKVKPKKEKKKEVKEEIVKEEVKEKEEKIEVHEEKEETNVESKPKDINDQIQSFVSILFTIIIFLAIILLIFILYNNYFKKKNVNLDKVCSDYIEKDYGITEEMVNNFVKNGRAIIYNYDNFSKKNLSNSDLIKFASFFIWSQDLEYTVCEDEDSKCLVSKMEMDKDTLRPDFMKKMEKLS